MIASAGLWILAWAGMFTGYWNLESPRFTWTLLGVFQGVRAFFPLLAVFLCLLWALKWRPRNPFERNPLGFLAAYAGVGLATSLFLTTDLKDSIYNAGLFMSAILVMWFVLEQSDPREALRGVIYLNYALVLLLAMALVPEALRIFRGRESFTAFYQLPFGIGSQTKNGAGRFALIAVIVCFCRFFYGERGLKRNLWLGGLTASLFLLMMTQSRTALLGLGVISILFVMMRGIDWRLLFAGPVAAYVLWVSGIKWRVQGRLSELLMLSGRDVTWKQGISRILESPLLGWGFNADRILLNEQHMHNSYLQAMIQTGFFGLVFFTATFFASWWVVARYRVFARLRTLPADRKILLTECILILGFMTARSFFESTAAFYGVDLLLLAPAIAVINLEARETTPVDDPPSSQGLP